MSIIIRVYLLISISLVAFDIAFLFINRRRKLAAYKINTSFDDEIRKALADRRECGNLSSEFLSSLFNRLSITKNMITLQQIIETDKEAKQCFQAYVWAQMKNYARRKDETEQAYYTYILSTFDYSQSKPVASDIAELLNFLESNSLYTFSNTMMALCAIGDSAALLRAVEKIDERPGFYHKKLLVDGLLTARFEDVVFDSQLQERFDRYTSYTQDCLLDYFRIKGLDVAELCLRLIYSPKTDSQVRYTAMRYFVKYPNPEAKKRFLEILADEDAVWLEQMLSIQALRRYDDSEVRRAIETKVTSRNWYVRVSAVEFMYRNGMSREDIFDILHLRDRYANECLLYQYREDKEMTRYIIDTVQMLNIQAEATQLSENAVALCSATTSIERGDQNVGLYT